MTKPWTASRGAINAGLGELEMAATINALLVYPIGLLVFCLKQTATRSSLLRSAFARIFVRS
ncbi:hypothetical protein AB4Z52_25075 [Rhizobium sp. 2YAF20]|uniref:hypothetical protein n=1 Tax=Rhizobium sp. 2YAF20 TaxID=3233027 RepID=UPI003F981D3C